MAADLGGAALRLFVPDDDGRDRAEAGLTRRWRINGWGARIHLWTDAQVEAMGEPPADAARYECGVWAALRIG